MSPDPALIAALLGGVVGLVLALSGAGGGGRRERALNVNERE